MADPNDITAITKTLAQATLGDGALPTNIKLPNTISSRAAITSLTTMFEVIWYKASRTIWLQYASRERAAAACEALQGKQVAGVYVRCHVTEPHHPQPFQFSVELREMPDHVVLADIRPRLPGRENPDGLSYGNLNYQADINAIQRICDRIRARTNESIKYRNVIEMKNGAKQKAEITLDAEAANLEAHANALDGIVIPQLGNTRVFFSERLRLHVAVESEFYKRRTKTLKGIAERAWDTHHIKMKILDGELRHVQNTFLILITGNGRAAVQQVKGEIDDCVAKDAIKGLQRKANLPK